MKNCIEVTPWPEDLRERYYREGIWQGRPLYDLLQRSATQFPDHTAVIDGNKSWCYRELRESSLRIAAMFTRYGLNPGDRVVLHLPNSGEFLEALFACFYLGVVPVLALPAHRYHELNAFISQSGAKAYIGCHPNQGSQWSELCDLLNTHHSSLTIIALELSALNAWGSLACWSKDSLPFQIREPDGEALALLQLSGGTTSAPKLIPRTHNDYLYSVEASAEICKISERTRYLVTLPMAHNFTLSSPGVLGVLLSGGLMVIANDGSPDSCFPLIARHGITMTALVPPIANIWVQAQSTRRQPFNSLNVIQVGGAKLSEAVARKVPELFDCTLQQVFGMAEGLVNYTRLDDDDELTMTTQGRPISIHDEIRIVDDNDEAVAPGAEGNLLTRGPYTIRGYYRAQEYNKKAFTEDGFYRTGDIVRLNPEGYLVVTGRSKDQINRGGEKIAADEVENLLMTHPAVLDVALVSTPDRLLGEKTCAFLIVGSSDKPFSIKSLRQYMRQMGVANYKIPDRFESLSEFPKTHFGKVSKKALRERLIQGFR